MNEFKFLTDNIPDVPAHRDDWWNEADVVQQMNMDDVATRIQNMLNEQIEARLFGGYGNAYWICDFGSWKAICSNVYA